MTFAVGVAVKADTHPSTRLAHLVAKPKFRTVALRLLRRVTLWSGVEEVTGCCLSKQLRRNSELSFEATRNGRFAKPYLRSLQRRRQAATIVGTAGQSQPVQSCQIATSVGVVGSR